jgi:integrase
MATLNHFIRKYSKKDNYSIYLRLRIGRDIDITASTGKFIKSNYWSDNTKDFKTTISAPKEELKHFNSLKEQIRNLKSKIENKLNDFPKSEITSDWLKNEIENFNNPDSNKTYSNYLTNNFDYLLEDASIRENQKGGYGLSKSRINAYKNTKRLILEFEKLKRKRLRVYDVNLEFKKRFLSFLINEKQFTKNYALKILSNVKSVCNNAETLNIEVNPQLKKIKTKSIKNEFIIYLDNNELQRIKELDLSHSKALENARKWLLLGCNIGQRATDLLNISDDNFVYRNGRKVIEIVQQKTNKEVTIPLNKEAKEIYDTGLPYKISIQKFNTYCKDVCKLAEINRPTKGQLFNNETKRTEIGIYEKWQLISTHVCRRSYATNYYGSGIPTVLLMQVTAHSTEKMFLKYIGKKSADYAQQIAEYYDKINLTEKTTPAEKTENLKAV